jgi:hypothetical protein
MVALNIAALLLLHQLSWRGKVQKPKHICGLSCSLFLALIPGRGRRRHERG